MVIPKKREAVVVSASRGPDGMWIAAECDEDHQVTDRQHRSIRVGGQGVDGIEDRLWDSACLVDQDQWVQSMNSLERILIVVSALPTKGDEFFPPGPMYHSSSSVIRPEKAALAMSLAAVSPPSPV
jgi:hypothetical protein